MTVGSLSVESIFALLAEHLWQSTVVALGATALVLCFRRQTARIRYAIWLTASLKFLVPLAVLTALGEQLPWRPPADLSVSPRISTVWSVTQSFAARNRPDPTTAEVSSSAAQRWSITSIFIAVWLAGSIVVGLRRVARSRAAAALRRESLTIDAGREAEIFRRRTQTTSTRVELRRPPGATAPGVVGVLRPVLLWPADLSPRLTDSQIDAIVTHELGHVRGRHNLAALLHAIVETLFWFHPLVWYVGARLVDERERACDELVLEAGAEREHYADAILRVCELGVSNPAVSTGITGPTLIHRIEAIMAHHRPTPLNWRHRILLLAASSLLLLGPVAAGVLSADARQTTGGIAGVVTDQSGAAIEGAEVTARSSSGGIESRVRTNAAGRFVLDPLPVGDYDVRVQQLGFAPRVVALSVRAGQVTVANAALNIGQVSESIHIQAVASDSSRTASGVTQIPQAVSERLGPALPYFEEAAALYRLERFAESSSALERGLALLQPQVASRPEIVQGGGQLDPPTKIRDLKPVYPATARAAGAAGTVILEARIAEDGTVRDAKVQQSVPGLDEAALGAVRQWLYRPVRLNGVPVPANVTIAVRYDLPAN